MNGEEVLKIGLEGFFVCGAMSHIQYNRFNKLLQFDVELRKRKRCRSKHSIEGYVLHSTIGTRSFSVCFGSGAHGNHGSLLCDSVAYQ